MNKKFFSSAENNPFRDWLEGTRKFNVWGGLAWSDIILRYRRSALGPLWITISMAILIAGMGPLYASIFGVQLGKFFPHLALGIIFWTFFSSIVQDSSLVYVSSANYLKQGGFPVSLFLWRMLARNFIQFLHHIIIYIPIVIFLKTQFDWNVLWFFPALILFLINAHLVSISISIIATRFRDVAQIIASGMQLLMFLTPVFWLPESLPSRAQFVMWNPLAQMLDLLRTPLMGGEASLNSWFGILFWTFLNLFLSGYLFNKYRRRIAFWI